MDIANLNSFDDYQKQICNKQLTRIKYIRKLALDMCENGNKMNVTGEAGQVGILAAWPVTSVSEFSDESIET